MRNLRTIRANSRSIGFNPSCPSTTNRMRSLSSIARAASVWTSAVNCVSPAPTIPPVSHSRNGWPRISHLAEIRSRVIPGCPCTIAIRRPAMRLNRADFPTFGLPTIAISMIATSGRCFPASSTASSPEFASAITSKSPCCSRIRRSPWRMRVWSSASRILVTIAWQCSSYAGRANPGSSANQSREIPDRSTGGRGREWIRAGSIHGGRRNARDRRSRAGRASSRSASGGTPRS